MSQQLDSLMARTQEIEWETWQYFLRVVVECSSILKNIEPGRRRPWLAVVVQERHQAQGGLCALCSEPVSPSEWEIDHRIPFCYGGGNEPANLQIAHLTCNRQKGKLVEPIDLLRYLEGRYLNLHARRFSDFRSDPGT